MIMETRHFIPEILSHQALFRGLDGAELTRLARGTYEYRVGKNEMLFHKGELPAGMHLVITGQVKLTLPGSAGVEKIALMVGAGETFADPAVRTEAERFEMFRADITQESAEATELTERHRVQGVPTVIFLGISAATGTNHSRSHHRESAAGSMPVRNTHGSVPSAGRRSPVIVSQAAVPPGYQPTRGDIAARRRWTRPRNASRWSQVWAVTMSFVAMQLKEVLLMIEAAMMSAWRARALGAYRPGRTNQGVTLPSSHVNDC